MAARKLGTTFEFHINAAFTSYESFQECVERYENANFCKLYTRRSRTIESALKRTPKRHFNEALKFAELELCCIHGGKKFISHSTGLRPNQSTFQKGCPFMIRVKATDDGDYLMISSISGNHNHALNKESYDHLPSVRKLDADDRKMAEQMLAMKVDKKVVQNHLIQKTQKQVLLYDLHNIAAAYNKSKGDCDSLPKEMKKKGNILPKEMKKEGNGLPKEMKKDVDQHKRSGPSTRTTDGMVALSWNNHSATFCHMLSAFRQKDKYTDAMLACEGKFYPVHKLVLSTCSQYFEEMFDHTLGKHPIVLLQDVMCNEIEALLSYMYVGVVSVAQKDLARLIKVAELLQIKGLAVPDEVQTVKDTVSHSNSKNARRSPQSREFVDSTDDRGSPHPKRRKQDDSSSSSPRELFENNNAHSPRLSSYSKDGEGLDYSTSEDRIRREVYPEQVRGSESETESLHHRESAASNSVPEESNMLSGVKLQEQSATRNPSKDTSEDAIVIKEEVWEDPELSHNNSIDPSVTGSDSADPDSHDGVQEERTGTSKGFSYPGVPAQGSQELPEVVVEALAGPSGMQEWLGSNDFAAGLASVENFSINGSPPLSEHPQALQLAGEESQKGDKGATGGKAGIISSSKFHQCPYCAYDTPRKDHLVMHIRTHTGEKPYSCPYCPSRFVQKGTLSNHIRTHTGEKPFSCPHCSQCFARNSHLWSHVSTRHKGRLSTAT